MLVKDERDAMSVLRSMVKPAIKKGVLCLEGWQSMNGFSGFRLHHRKQLNRDIVSTHWPRRESWKARVLLFSQLYQRRSNTHYLELFRVHDHACWCTCITKQGKGHSIQTLTFHSSLNRNGYTALKVTVVVSYAISVSSTTAIPSISILPSATPVLIAF